MFIFAVQAGSTVYEMSKKQEIEALFLYATEGIIVVDDQGRIVRINPSAEALFGYNKNELTGQKIEVLIPGRFNHKHIDHRGNYNAHPSPRSMGIGRELFGLRKDGTEFPVEISLSPYTEQDSRFIIAFIIDITIRKQAEERLRQHSMDLENQVRKRTLVLEEAIHELEKTKNELNTSLEKERELGELKSRFVSMASHEFRTPLTTILSSLSLVTKYGDLDDKEKQNKHINRIKSSINNLTDILNDFLSVGKLEEGKIEYTPALFDIRSFIEEVVEEMRGLLKEGQAIQFYHEAEDMVMLDPKLLKHILFNLLSNAIKFSKSGDRVEILSSRKNGDIRLYVKDSGIGIPESDKKHLTERFFRGRNTTHIQGTGLGLYIVVKYTELMGGKIEIESEENKGTTFIVTLPQ